jgi:hypothetical protein
MKKGEEAAVHGTMNKLQTIVAGVLPESVTAQQGRKMNEPGGGE